MTPAAQTPALIDLTVKGEPGMWRIYRGDQPVSGWYAYKNDALEHMRLGIFTLHRGVRS